MEFYIVPKAAADGTIRVSPNRARRLAVALATGRHPWTFTGEHFQGALALPESADPVAAADACEAAGDFAGGFKPSDIEGAPPVPVMDYWRPKLVATKAGWEWKPLTGSSHRFITISRKGEVRWNSGHGHPSQFIGGALVAAAGGYAALPHGVVSLVRVEGTAA